jgi:hypothetical protein
VIAMAALGILLSARRGRLGIALYLAVALCACGIEWAVGTTPWVIGKSLALSSPALLTAALAGAALLMSTRWRTRRALPAIAGAALGSVPQAHPGPAAREPARGPGHSRTRRALAFARWLVGLLAMLAIAGGVIWSNVLTYTDVTLAPRPRLVELQHIGELVKGKGPTFINEYEVYADRHFLREGAPVEPAEYRPVTLPLRSGAVLTKAAWANLDAFPLSTLLPYRSIVTRRTPAESRPPSYWKLAWQGAYYDLWQRPEPAPSNILEHIPYGEENTHPYCGAAQETSAPEPICSMVPTAIPSCPQLLGFARKAISEHAHLLAYVRPRPTFTYGDEVLWPRGWLHEPVSHSLQPTAPGTAVGHIRVPSSRRYELFLAGGFGRGLEVSVDGRHVGAATEQLSGFISWTHVADVYLTAGVHRFEYTYPQAGLAPGSGEDLATPGDPALDRFTTLAGVELQPQSPPARLVSLPPSRAPALCNQPLEWLEVVRGPAAGA